MEQLLIFKKDLAITGFEIEDLTGLKPMMTVRSGSKKALSSLGETYWKSIICPTLINT